MHNIVPRPISVASPVRILVALTLLYVQLGVAAFAAVALLVMLMPVQVLGGGGRHSVCL